MSEQTPEQQAPEQDKPVNVEGDAVINNAPDGGGVDNNAPQEQPQPKAD